MCYTWGFILKNFPKGGVWHRQCYLVSILTDLWKIPNEKLEILQNSVFVHTFIDWMWVRRQNTFFFYLRIALHMAQALCSQLMAGISKCSLGVHIAYVFGNVQISPFSLQLSNQCIFDILQACNCVLFTSLFAKTKPKMHQNVIQFFIWIHPVIVVRNP